VVSSSRAIFASLGQEPSSRCRSCAVGLQPKVCCIITPFSTRSSSVFAPFESDYTETGEREGCGLNVENFALTMISLSGYVMVTATSSYLLPRLLGYSRAVALLLTGGTYSPDSPLLQGLYHETFPNREDVFPAALAFARELAANTSQTSIAWTKALLWRGADSIEGQHILDSRGISDLASRADAAEGALAFKERRPVEFKDVLSKDLSDFVPWVCHSCHLHLCPVFLS
jgi:hypothetical protein